MNIERERTAVVAEAMTWLGTNYHAHARIKGVGVDCAQFVLGVYTVALGITEPEIPPYAIDWFMHSSQEKYLEGLAPYMMERSHLPPDALPGDLVLFRFGRANSHAGIVTAWPEFVHADRQIGKVTLDSLEDGQPYRARLSGVFTLLRWQKVKRAVQR